MVVISRCIKQAHYLVVIATNQAHHFSWFLQPPSNGAAYPTGLEQLLK